MSSSPPDTPQSVSFYECRVLRNEKFVILLNLPKLDERYQNSNTKPILRTQGPLAVYIAEGLPPSPLRDFI